MNYYVFLWLILMLLPGCAIEAMPAEVEILSAHPDCNIQTPRQSTQAQSCKIAEDVDCTGVLECLWPISSNRHGDNPWITDIAFIKKVVSFLLHHMVYAEELTPDNKGYREFQDEPTDMSLPSWVSFIVQQSKIPRSVVVLALMNIQRILTMYPQLKIVRHNVRRIFFINCMIASKTLEDSPYKNKQWAAFSSYYSPYKVTMMEREAFHFLQFQPLSGFINPSSTSEAETLVGFAAQFVRWPEQLTRELFIQKNEKVPSHPIWLQPEPEPATAYS